MSLEQKIEALTNAVIALTARLGSPVVAATSPAPAPVAAAPVVVPLPTPAPTAMPALPTFTMPAAAAPASGAPFSDGKGLIEYVMGAYKAMGPAKGAQIQGVLTSMGYTNINDVKAEHYAALHAGVEALKG